MNFKALCKDLESISDEVYFTKELLSSDFKVYKRRSFDDLVRRYKPKGVSEELLLKALYKTGFSCKICNAIKKVVFAKIYDREIDSIWGTGQTNMGYTSGDSEKTKYTRQYITDLFNKIK